MDTNHHPTTPGRCCPHGFMDHVAPENFDMIDEGLFPLDCMFEGCPCNGLADFDQEPLDPERAALHRKVWELLDRTIPLMMNAPWN